MAKRFDFKLDQGSDLTLTVSTTVADGTADLTGYEAAMQVRASHYADRAADTLTTKNGRLSIDTTSGKITVTFPHAVTEKYPAPECVYDIELISPDDKIFRMLEGTISVSREVTRVNLSAN